MKHSPFAIMCVLFLFVIPAALLHGQSYYPEKPEDPGAVYFTPDNFTIHADGMGDDSDARRTLSRVQAEEFFYSRGSLSYHKDDYCRRNPSYRLWQGTSCHCIACKYTQFPVGNRQVHVPFRTI